MSIEVVCAPFEFLMEILSREDDEVLALAKLAVFFFPVAIAQVTWLPICAALALVLAMVATPFILLRKFYMRLKG